jgi:hypothetical protein
VTLLSGYYVVPVYAILDEDKAREVKEEFITFEGGRYYHVSGRLHVHPIDESYMTEWASEEDVKDAGFRPCPVCFGEQVRYGDKYEIERMIAAEAAGMIESRYRVFYDSPVVFWIETNLSGVTAVSDRPYLDYRVYLLDTRASEVFVCPNGVIYFTKGMLEMIDTDMELRVILANLVSRIDGRHGLKQLRVSSTKNVFKDIVEIATSQSPRMIEFAAISKCASCISDNDYEDYLDEDSDRLTVYILKRMGIDRVHYKRYLKKLFDYAMKNRQKDVYFFNMPLDLSGSDDELYGLLKDRMELIDNTVIVDH